MSREIIKQQFKNPPVLKTSRLVLRKMLKRDYKDMYEYASNPEVTKYLLWDPHINEHYTLKYLAYIQTRYRAGDFYDWALIDNKSGKMIGTCGFAKFNFEASSAEIGYVINPSYWHMGIALEAVKEVIRFGFHSLGLHRIEARYICGNENSRHVMEKAGMKFEGIAREAMFVKGRFVSVGTCAVLSKEYIH